MMMINMMIVESSWRKARGILEQIYINDTIIVTWHGGVDQPTSSCLLMRYDGWNKWWSVRWKVSWWWWSRETERKQRHNGRQEEEVIRCAWNLLKDSLADDHDAEWLFEVNESWLLQLHSWKQNWQKNDHHDVAYQNNKSQNNRRILWNFSLNDHLMYHPSNTKWTVNDDDHTKEMIKIVRKGEIICCFWTLISITISRSPPTFHFCIEGGKWSSVGRTNNNIITGNIIHMMGKIDQQDHHRGRDDYLQNGRRHDTGLRNLLSNFVWNKKKYHQMDWMIIRWSKDKQCEEDNRTWGGESFWRRVYVDDSSFSHDCLYDLTSLSWRTDHFFLHPSE